MAQHPHPSPLPPSLPTLQQHEDQPLYNKTETLEEEGLGFALYREADAYFYGWDYPRIAIDHAKAKQLWLRCAREYPDTVPAAVGRCHFFALGEFAKDDEKAFNAFVLQAELDVKQARQGAVGGVQRQRVVNNQHEEHFSHRPRSTTCSTTTSSSAKRTYSEPQAHEQLVLQLPPGYLKGVGVFLLSFCYLEGVGVRQDISAGLAFLQEACSAKWVRTPQEESQASIHHLLSHQQRNSNYVDGYPPALNNLARVFFHGKYGTAPDLQLAADIYRAAAAKGLASAQWELGRAQLDGKIPMLSSAGHVLAGGDDEARQFILEAAMRGHETAIAFSREKNWLQVEK